MDFEHYIMIGIMLFFIASLWQDVKRLVAPKKPVVSDRQRRLRRLRGVVVYQLRICSRCNHAFEATTTLGPDPICDWCEAGHEVDDSRVFNFLDIVSDPVYPNDAEFRERFHIGYGL